MMVQYYVFVECSYMYGISVMAFDGALCKAMFLIRVVLIFELCIPLALVIISCITLPLTGMHKSIFPTISGFYNIMCQCIDCLRIEGIALGVHLAMWFQKSQIPSFLVAAGEGRLQTKTSYQTAICLISKRKSA